MSTYGHVHTETLDNTSKKSSGHECLQGTGKEFIKRPAKYQLWFTFYMFKFQYSCK